MKTNMTDYQNQERTGEQTEDFRNELKESWGLKPMKTNSPTKKKLFKTVTKNGKTYAVNKVGSWICPNCLGVDGCECYLVSAKSVLSHINQQYAVNVRQNNISKHE